MASVASRHAIRFRLVCEIVTLSKHLKRRRAARKLAAESGHVVRFVGGDRGRAVVGF
jgi:hypothetical protein